MPPVSPLIRSRPGIAGPELPEPSPPRLTLPLRPLCCCSPGLGARGSRQSPTLCGRRAWNVYGGARPLPAPPAASLGSRKGRDREVAPPALRPRPCILDPWGPDWELTRAPSARASVSVQGFHRRISSLQNGEWAPVPWASFLALPQELSGLSLPTPGTPLFSSQPS